MNDEQRELAIWGGGALLGVLLLAWFTAGQAAAVRSHNATIDRLYPSYQRHYAEGANRVSLSEAQATVRAAKQAQQLARERVEAVLLAPWDTRVIQAHRLSGGSAVFSYNQVVDEIDARYRSLRAKAQRLAVGQLPGLPHEGAERIQRGDDAPALQARSLQLAEVLLVHRLLDYLVDLGVTGITMVETLPLIADQTTQPSYAGLGLRVSAVLEQALADRLLHELRSPELRMALEGLVLAPDARNPERFVIELSVRRFSEWPEGWDPALLLAGANRPAAPNRSGRGRGQ
ncbi:MAG: hypothetical protein EA402_10220 [Planctomycetota bacterium]|nr:MAG: hypothetical protein EA402_10220 [Planctomycetota bacterium]